jgi:hypothetical protein
MSVGSMANVAVARRDDDLGSKDAAGDPSPPTTVEEVAEAAGGQRATANAATSTLTSIATYIPTEVIGLYLAALAAVRAGVNPQRVSAATAEDIGTLNMPSDGEVTVAILFTVCTPLIVWLVYAAKVRAGGGAPPLSPRIWPRWEMFAATVGFVAWSFSLPDSPFARFSWYNVAWATFVVLAVSTGLGLIGPVFARQIRT